MERIASRAPTIDRERPVVFYCRGGVRSGLVANAFQRAGFDAFSMVGGMTAWVERGLPLEFENGTVAPHQPHEEERPRGDPAPRLVLSESFRTSSVRGETAVPSVRPPDSHQIAKRPVARKSDMRPFPSRLLDGYGLRLLRTR
jgi:3-mercaptopyruvate sulfurtransferase SseA